MRKRKALLAWELGQGLGHAATLAVLGEALARRGLDVVCALADPAAATAARMKGLRIVKAPQWPPVAQAYRARELRAPASQNLGQVLARTGFHDPAVIASMLRGWDAVLEQERPDLVVADFAPGLILAARGRIRSAAIGEGYSMPPRDCDSFPQLHPVRGPFLVPAERLLENVNRALAETGRPAEASWFGSLLADKQFPCTFPLVDPHASIRNERYWGLLQPSLPDIAAEPPGIGFVYLAADALAHAPVTQAIVKLGTPCLVFAPGAPAETVALFRGAGHKVVEVAADLSRVLPRVRAVIHRGGHGLASMALAAGRPQFALTTHQENFLTARLLKRAGVGDYERLDTSGEGLADRLRGVFANQPMARRALALALARDLRASFPVPATGPVADRLAAMAG